MNLGTGIQAAIAAATSSGFDLSTLGNALGTSAAALVLGLIVTGQLRLPREMKVATDARDAEKVRADRYEQMVLRLLTTTEKVTAIADREVP